MDRKTPPPIFRELVADTGFDPDGLLSMDFRDWTLHETYPPTVGELMLGLVPAETETHDAQSDQASTGSDPGGSGGPVSGQPEDSDQVDNRREDHGGDDTGTASPVCP